MADPQLKEDFKKLLHARTNPDDFQNILDIVWKYADFYLVLSSQDYEERLNPQRNLLHKIVGIQINIVITDRSQTENDGDRSWTYHFTEVELTISRKYEHMYSRIREFHLKKDKIKFPSFEKVRDLFIHGK